MALRQNFEQVFFDNTIPVKVLVQRLSTYKLHWHPQPELIYVVRGHVCIHVDGEAHELREGEMFYIVGDQLHSVNKTEDDNLLVAIQFDAEFFGMLPALKSSAFRATAFLQDQAERPEDFQVLRDAIVSIVWQYNKQPLGFPYQIASHAFQILATLAYHEYFAAKPPCTFEQERSLRLINRIVDHINSHYAENLSLRAFADQEHISYYHLSHIFKEITGVTFREHLCNVRLHKSTLALRNSRDSILNIAGRYGFSTARGYSAAFQARYGVTPGDYRKQFSREHKHPQDALHPADAFAPGNENMLYDSVNNDVDLSYIYSLYRHSPTIASANAVWQKEVALDIDMRGRAQPLRHVWSAIGACGRAADLLRKNVQEQVAATARVLGYQYLRFHGIFCDDMMVYNRRTDGTVVYNWLYVDMVLDFLHGQRLRPFLELSFMPCDLAEGDRTIYFYRANITRPRDMGAWSGLVTALLAHCCERYGFDEVAQWYVEVWNEPDYHDVFWAGDMDDYFALYEASARAVKAACPAIRVGGPAITHFHYATSPWLEQFLRMCKDRNVPCDFISYHMYADCTTTYSEQSNPRGLYPTITKTPAGAKVDTRVEADLIATHHQTAERCGFGHLPHIISEWNISAKQRFRVRDTAFMAPYVIDSALRARSTVHALCYWCVSDLIEEFRAPTALYHGGLGLVNPAGIPKPAYWAFAFLHCLGSDVLAQGENYIVTRSAEGYQVLLYNLVMLDQIAQKNTDFSSEYGDDLYALFEERPVLRFQLSLKGLRGAYRVRTYELNREHGSSYDRWAEMGKLENCSRNEIEYLQHVSVPKLSSSIGWTCGMRVCSPPTSLCPPTHSPAITSTFSWRCRMRRSGP